MNKILSIIALLPLAQAAMTMEFVNDLRIQVGSYGTATPAIIAMSLLAATRPF